MANEWRREHVQRVIEKGNVEEIMHEATRYMGESFGNIESEAQESAQAEILRLAKIGKEREVFPAPLSFKSLNDYKMLQEALRIYTSGDNDLSPDEYKRCTEMIVEFQRLRDEHK